MNYSTMGRVKSSHLKILCDARELMEEDEDEEKVKTQTDEEEQKEGESARAYKYKDRELNHVERNKRTADAYSSRVERDTKQKLRS